MSDNIQETIEAYLVQVEKDFPEAEMIMVFSQSCIWPERGRKDAGGNPAQIERRETVGRCVIRVHDAISDRTEVSVARAIREASREIRAKQRGKSLPTSGKSVDSEKSIALQP